MVSWTAVAQDSLEQVVSGPFSVRFHPADRKVAETTLKVLTEAADDYAKNLPLGRDAVEVTICSTLAEFRQLAGQYGRAQVGGIAKSMEGVIVLKSPRLLPSQEDFAGGVRHELIHVLLARNTNPAFVPRWFNEGIAMVVSREMRWESTLRIGRMYARRSIITYRDLDFAFAPLGDETKFGDAYAQALSMTQFLMDRIGKERFWQLLRGLKDMPFEKALEQYASMTPGDLYQSWRHSLWKFALITGLVSGFGLFQFAAILVIIAYWRKRQKGRALLREWEEEEEGEDFDPPFSWDTIEDVPSPWEEDDEDR